MREPRLCRKTKTGLAAPFHKHCGKPLTRKGNTVTNRYLPTPVLNRVVEKDGLVFVGGTACDDTSLDIAGQTRQTIAKLETYLEAAGSDKSKLLFATIYLSDLSLKPSMSDVWAEWIPAESLPARATICPGDLGPGVLIEVTLIAYK